MTAPSRRLQERMQAEQRAQRFPHNAARKAVRLAKGYWPHVVGLMLVGGVLTYVATNRETAPEALRDNFPAEAIGIVVGALFTYVIVERIVTARIKERWERVALEGLSFLVGGLSATENVFRVAFDMSGESEEWKPRELLSRVKEAESQLHEAGSRTRLYDWEACHALCALAKHTIPNMVRLASYASPFLARHPELIKALASLEFYASDVVSYAETYEKNPNLSDEDRARRLAEHLVDLLEAVVEADEQATSVLEALRP